MKDLLRRGIRFALVGIANTAVGLLLIYALMYLGGASAVTANVIGYGLGLGLSFMLNRLWTFEDRGPVGPRLPSYLVVVAVAYLANLAVLLATTRHAHIDAYAAQLLGVVAYAGLSFLGCHFWVFRKRTLA